MTSLRKNTDRAKLAVVMLSVMVGLDVLSAISSFMQYQLLSDFRDGVFFSEADGAANDLRESIIGAVYTLFYIVTVVVFIQWFRRAYFNLHLRTQNLRHSEGWAAGAWFIPIFNLYATVQIMMDLYKESRNVLRKAGFTEELDLPTNLVSIWWALWVLGSITSNINTRMILSENLNSLVNGSMIAIFAHLLSLGAAITLIFVIQKYAKVEPLLSDLRSEIDSIGQNTED